MHNRLTYPRNPKGTAFANFGALWLACGTLGARYSRSNCSGLSEMLVVVWVNRCGSFAILFDSAPVTMGSVVVVVADIFA